MALRSSELTGTDRTGIFSAVLGTSAASGSGALEGLTSQPFKTAISQQNDD